VLELAVVEDGRWCELARRLKAHPKTGRRWTLVSIKRLAAVWHLDTPNMILGEAG
jgi:hypothetical protein